MWGANGSIEVRVERDDDLDGLVQQAHQRGGLFSINHPKATPNCLGCDWEYLVSETADCFEAWQGPWLYRNWESLARYDALLQKGERLTLVGGSDRHQPGWPDHDPQLLQVGSPTTWLYLEGLSVAGLLDALRICRGFVSESPEGPRLEITLDGVPMGSSLSLSQLRSVGVRAVVQDAQGGLLRWVGYRGVVGEMSIAGDAFEDAWIWRPKGPFLRAEVVARGEAQQVEETFRRLEALGKVPVGLSLENLTNRERVRALSNPVYLGG